VLLAAVTVAVTDAIAHGSPPLAPTTLVPRLMTPRHAMAVAMPVAMAVVGRCVPAAAVCAAGFVSARGGAHGKTLLGGGGFRGGGLGLER
jgi:hypothetical protein